MPPAGKWAAVPESGAEAAAGMNAQDVLHAWRDFECSFFAGALLCPKVPFRRFLTRESHRIEAGEKIELTPAVMMRRMTKVSPYPYWHFFRRLSARVSARGVTAATHTAALGQHGASHRSLSELGGFSHAQ